METPGEDKMNEKSAIKVTKKYYERNQRVRRKFQSSLDKIQSTCLKYATSDDSTMETFPPIKNFSLGES